MNKPMFRAAALSANKASALGEIILIRPFSYRILTAAAFLIALFIIFFMIWGRYTQRSTVIGQLVPDTGLVKVYAPQFGIVKEKRVNEGQPVQQGDVLYILSSERQSDTQGSIQASISQRVEARRHSLRDEEETTKRLQVEEREALSNRIEGIKGELLKLEGLIDSQKTRLDLSKNAQIRYTKLLKQDYISRDQLQQKQEDLLEQSVRLQSLEREYITLERELEARNREFTGLALKHANQLLQIERSISSIDQELAESEGKRQLVITAPQTGTATALLADPGQTVDAGRPLASIIPAHAHLQAHLYAPSRAVGFIQTDAEVMLRYQAYPYQKFGHARGRVASVSKTALPANEVSGLANTRESNSEPLYRITIELEKQTLLAYGKNYSLQAGMLLEADILQDTRQLYEWVLEPLYSLSGKL